MENLSGIEALTFDLFGTVLDIRSSLLPTIGALLSEHEKSGKEAVTRFFKEVIHKNVSGSKEGHFTGQPVISVDGDRAKGHWMFYRFVPGPSPTRWVQGRYDCEYVKVNGKWKFRFLKLTRPWPAFFRERRS